MDPSTGANILNSEYKKHGDLRDYQLTFLYPDLVALPGLMLDLGLLKIIWRECFFIFLATAGGSNPEGQS